jgi:putative DNA primase/helicase
MAEVLVKQLTGGDRMKARFMRQDLFEFEPQHKIWLAANHKPVIRGTDYAIWRRIRLIPFDVTIPENERDPHLIDKLQAELPGILAWCVRGCMAWQRQGLGMPERVRAATNAYQAEMDLVAQFLEENCVLNSLATVTAGVLYAEYRTWCEQAGENPRSQRWLSGRLKERGITTDSRDTYGRALYRGLGLIAKDGPND